MNGWKIYTIEFRVLAENILPSGDKAVCRIKSIESVIQGA